MRYVALLGHKVVNNVRHFMSTNQPAGSSINLALKTAGNGLVKIDWGDGSPVIQVASSTSVYQSHTYASAFNGNVKIWAVGTGDYITEWRSTVGRWSFNVADLPSGLTYYRNTGQNTTNGSLADLPSGLTYYDNQGNNTTSGSIASLPSGLTYYINLGDNTTSGSVAGLPSGLMHYINRGQNTTSGSIASLPSGLTYYRNTGQNTTNGSLADLPSGLTIYLNEGNNTTSGSIADLPSGLMYYLNTGNNTCTMPVSTWGAAKVGFRYFYHRGVGLSQSHVDNVLVAMKSITSWSTEKTVDLTGTNSAPSQVGLDARLILLSNGATSVLVN